MPWFEIELKLPEEKKEATLNYLFEIGASGVAETSKDATSPLATKAYFETDNPRNIESLVGEFLLALQANHPDTEPATFSLKPVVMENWAEKYKDFYQAQPISKKFFLKPAWDKVTKVPDSMFAIEMDPGQAFGTGLHPSTRLALSLFEKESRKLGDVHKLRWIDVGTGSGILAIAAYRLGWRRITAIDIDETAVVTAADNFKLNGCSGIDLSTKPLNALSGPFDFVVSNILLQTHQDLMADYLKVLAPQGSLILSGLLGYQRDEIFALLEQHGLQVDEQANLQEWLALLVRRTHE